MEPAGQPGRRQLCRGSGGLRKPGRADQRSPMAERFGRRAVGRFGAQGHRRGDQHESSATDQLSAARHRPFRRAGRNRTGAPMKKTSRSHHGALNELNITPLLDLVFVLLVIFIITTPQMMNNLEMTLPSGKPPPPQKEKPKINKIDVDAKGQTFLNDQAVTVAQLKDELQQLKSDNPDLSVVVKGDDDVDYQNMISVLDILQQLDITKVGLATQ